MRPIAELIKCVPRSYKEDGLKVCARKILSRVIRIPLFIYRRFLRSTSIYSRIFKSIFTVFFRPRGADNVHAFWRSMSALAKDERAAQKGHVFSPDITFSILVPLYNTPKKFLRDMIDSVRAQTYGKWELCLADGSNSAHDFVGRIVKEYAKKDGRIKYRKLDKNLGISGNTNVCIEMATGDYIALLDHDDMLHEAALFECMKAIEDEDADFIYTDEMTFRLKPKDGYHPNFKPDFAPDTLRSYNYICHLSVFSRELLNKAGRFRSEFDGSQDYDMVLRLTEKAKNIFHIRKILYYWRAHKDSVASGISVKPYAITAAKKAVDAHIARIGLIGKAGDSSGLYTYKINYAIKGNPLISIIIPNKDHLFDLYGCIDSILEKSTYKNFEILIVENNSAEKKTFDYYKKISKNEKVKILTWKKGFNYSAINNFAVKHAAGDYLLLLNNDTEVITPSWIEEMLMFAQRHDVGIVGAKLLYSDNTVQHAGVILTIGGIAGHAHRHYKRNDFGYMNRLSIVQNLSAVTGACMLIRKEVYREVGGFDEEYAVAFNDIDLCMKIRQRGYLIVFTPYAELYHYESKSRGYEDTPEKEKRFEGEVRLFLGKWKSAFDKGDPYYSPYLTLKSEDFGFSEKKNY